jgi:hypothetical protein
MISGSADSLVREGETGIGVGDQMDLNPIKFGEYP